MFGARTPRVCAFCGGRLPTSTFKNESHALPAGLGNRDLLSFEECDQCNTAYSIAENELVRMLEPQRMLSRGRRRRGESAPKMRGSDGDSYVTWDPETGRMRIFVSGDKSASFQVNEEKKTATLSVIRPAYNPLQALRSLLRSAWMICGTEFRQRHPELLEMVRNGVPLPSQYGEFSIGGEQARVGRMRVYEKQTAIPGADVVLQFSYGNTTLVFEVPSPGGGYPPSLLPPIDVLGDEQLERSGQLRRITVDEPQSADVFSASFTFERRVEGEVATDDPPSRSEGREAIEPIS
jgi:hypothetical protein